MFLVEMFSVIIQVFSFKVLVGECSRCPQYTITLNYLTGKKVQFIQVFIDPFIGAVFGLLSW